MGTSSAAARRTPFRDFTAPGRRRTDNPLVVGTIFLCVILLTIAAGAQIVCTIWFGNQLKGAMVSVQTREARTDAIRQSLFKNTEAQAVVLRRLCLNTARSDEDKKECLTVGPVLTIEGTKPHGDR